MVIRVLAVGECMLELQHMTGTNLVLGFGGDTYNTAVYLARAAEALGVDVEVGYLCGLGDDTHSELMREAWHQEGILDRSVTVSGKTPGLYAVRTDGEGERTFATGVKALRQLRFSPGPTGSTPWKATSSISQASAFVLVEAKRLRRSSFQADQLAKELILAAEHARDRHPVLLLVLGAPPPIRVQGHGTLSIEDAVRVGQERISARHGRQVAAPNPLDTVAWTTWAEIGAQVEAALQTYDNPDESTYNAVARVARTVADALQVHA